MATLKQGFEKVGQAFTGASTGKTVAEGTQGVLGHIFQGTTKHFNNGAGAGKLFGGLYGLAVDTVMFIPRAIGGTLGLVAKGGVTASVKTAEVSGRGALWVVKQPVVGLLHLTAGGISLIRKNPIPALLVAGTGAAIAMTNGSRDKAAAQTQQELMAQAMGGGQQAYGPAVTPEEYAQMEARMKQGGPGQTGFAEAIAAKRESAAATPQTAAAL
jgi:hypothetical protein